MTEGTFEVAGKNIQVDAEEAAAKMTGGDKLEAQGKRHQDEADGVEQDETETDAKGDEF